MKRSADIVFASTLGESLIHLIGGPVQKNTSFARLLLTRYEHIYIGSNSERNGVSISYKGHHMFFVAKTDAEHFHLDVEE